MAWFVEWTVFTLVGLTTLSLGYMYRRDNREQLILFGASFIFWIGSTAQWMYDHAGAGNLMLGIIINIAPLFVSFAWFMQALGAYVDQMGGKPSRYE